MKRALRDPTDVLTTDEVVAWLKVSERTIERHFTAFLPGRYLVSHVMERLDQLRHGRERPVAEGVAGG